MGSGRGRNDPCWCGSGKKFKHCHLGRHRDEPLEIWETDAALRKHFGTKCCMSPESLHDQCAGNIIRAHTVSKSGSLKQIAVDGHVYAFVPSLQSIAKGNGVLAPELRGINRSSTFTGFCAIHDTLLFAPLEDAAFEFTEEQLFLLAYRALARETFLKQAQRESAGLMRDADKGKPRGQQEFVQSFASRMQTGLDVGSDDALRQQATYDAVLLSGDFSGVRSLVLEFDMVPSVMCSAGLFPNECFDGSPAQDLLDISTPAQLIHYNSIATNGGGAVIFTWLPDSNAACDYFVSTLEAVDPAHVTDALLRFFFEYCENVQINPLWWDGLDKSTRKALVKRLNTAANPLRLRSPDCLASDGLVYDDWKLRKMYRLGPTSASS